MSQILSYQTGSGVPIVLMTDNHGLTCRRRQINDRQTSMAKAEGAVHVDAPAIRSPVRQAVGHALHSGTRSGRAIKVQNANYTAHADTPPWYRIFTSNAAPPISTYFVLWVGIPACTLCER
jgi:hypothetical protein